MTNYKLADNSIMFAKFIQISCHWIFAFDLYQQNELIPEESNEKVNKFCNESSKLLV